MGFLIRNSGYLLVALGACALKLHYSSATSDGLEWILAPTAWLVSLLTGMPFVRELGAGYSARDGGIVIAPGCAGVNFLIMCFCMLGFSFLHHVRAGVARWRWVFVSAVMAYVLTLIVNAIRIVLSIWTFESGMYLGEKALEQIHRLEGVVVYFPALLLIHWAVGRVMRCHQGTALPFPPIGWYLAITLGIPLLRGAVWENPMRYGAHACWVVGAVFVIATMAWMWRRPMIWTGPRRMVCILLVFIGIAAGGTYVLVDGEPKTNQRFDAGANGLWIGEEWYTGFHPKTGQRVTEEQVAALLERLKIHGIRHVYVRAGSLDSEGSLAKLPGQTFFKLQDRAPEYVFLPWVSGDTTRLPLADAVWRDNVIQTFGRLKSEGVRGIHLNLEPISSGDEDYLALLSEIQHRFDGAWYVSQTGRKLAPSAWMEPFFSKVSWSSDYYIETMRVSDETVLMAYNTRLRREGVYRWFVANQTRRVLECANMVPENRVLMGIPSYDHAPGLSHPEVENIANAAQGVRRGCETMTKSQQCLDGLAVYSDWHTDPGEWSDYRSFWQIPPGGSMNVVMME